VPAPEYRKNNGYLLIRALSMELFDGRWRGVAEAKVAVAILYVYPVEKPWRGM
jgi:hypothetical protein